MTRCPECESIGLSKREQELYACALCKQPRCEIHTVWVASHQLEGISERESLHLPSLSVGPVSGWHVFCGRPSHVPQGVSIRFGSEKKWGKLVEQISHEEKAENLDMFGMWQTGVIEEGFEHRWEKQHFEPSCDLSDAVNKINLMFDEDIDDDAFLRRTHSSVLEPLAVGKVVFFGPSLEEFRKSVEESPDIEEIIRFICSRCGVVICLNRHTPFFDNKLFKRLAEKPESVISL